MFFTAFIKKTVAQTVWLSFLFSVFFFNVSILSMMMIIVVGLMFLDINVFGSSQSSF